MENHKHTMYEAIGYLLQDLCVDLGFCIPPKEAEKIQNMRYLEASDFTSRVLLAEEMIPEYEKKWQVEISAKFCERFGQEISVNDFAQVS